MLPNHKLSRWRRGHRLSSCSGSCRRLGAPECSARVPSLVKGTRHTMITLAPNCDTQSAWNSTSTPLAFVFDVAVVRGGLILVVWNPSPKTMCPCVTPPPVMIEFVRK